MAGRFEPMVDIAGLESPGGLSSPGSPGPSEAPGLPDGPGGATGAARPGGRGGGGSAAGGWRPAVAMVDLSTPSPGAGGGGAGVPPARRASRMQGLERVEARAQKEREGATSKAQKERERAEAKAQKEKEKDEAKAQRERARTEARAEREKEAAAKRRERDLARRMRGNDCSANVSVLLSPGLLQMEGASGTQIVEVLKQKNYNFRIQSELSEGVTCTSAVDAPARCSVRWSWRLPAPGGAGDSLRAVPYAVYFFQGEAFVDIVVRKDLSRSVRQLLRLSGKGPGGSSPCSICLLLVGLESAVRKRERSSSNAPGQTFSRTGVEKAVAEITVNFRGVTIRSVADASEAAEHIAVLTKTIAMAPYKKDDEYTDFTTKVDIQETVSKGLGLDTWMRWLRQIPLGKKSAEAVVMEYPSLKELIAAYSSCSEAAQKALLQDLLEPPELKRRVGREASERVWRYLMAEDPDKIA